MLQAIEGKHEWKSSQVVCRRENITRREADDGSYDSESAREMVVTEGGDDDMRASSSKSVGRSACQGE